MAFNMCPKLDPLQVALCCERYRGSPLAQWERVLWLISDVCHGLSEWKVMVTMLCYFPSLEEERFLDSAELHFARKQNMP